MQQDARLAHCTAEQQQRLLLQHEQETARRLSHMGGIAGNIAAGYGQALPTIEINRVGKKRKMESPAQTIKSEPGGKGQPEHGNVSFLVFFLNTPSNTWVYYPGDQGSYYSFTHTLFFAKIQSPSLACVLIYCIAL